MFFVCLFVFWFGFFPLVEMMRGNWPRLVSVCDQACYPQLAVVEGGESLSYSKRVQVETQERQPWRVEEQRVVGKGMWDSVLCLPMTASVTFASQLISVSSTEKKIHIWFWLDIWTSPAKRSGVSRHADRRLMDFLLLRRLSLGQTLYTWPSALHL